MCGKIVLAIIEKKQITKFCDISMDGNVNIYFLKLLFNLNRQISKQVQGNKQKNKRKQKK